MLCFVNVRDCHSTFTMILRGLGDRASSPNSKSDPNLTVARTPVPHGVIFGFLLPELAKMEHPIVVLSHHCRRGVKIHTSTSAFNGKSNPTRPLKATGPQQSLFSILSTNVFTCLLRDTTCRLVARSYHVRIVF